MTKEELIRSVLLPALEEVLVSRESMLCSSTVLLGDGSVLDSLGLVTLIASVEQLLQDKTEKVVTLATETALSRKRSPFRSVDSLADYALELLAKE